MFKNLFNLFKRRNKKFDFSNLSLVEIEQRIASINQELDFLSGNNDNHLNELNNMPLEDTCLTNTTHADEDCLHSVMDDSMNNVNSHHYHF